MNPVDVYFWTAGMLYIVKGLSLTLWDYMYYVAWWAIGVIFGLLFSVNKWVKVLWPQDRHILLVE